MANKRNFYTKKTDSGFTLIELLLSTVLLLILIGPLLAFLRVGQINRSITTKTTDLEQNARAAMITMGRDITNAGFNFAPQFSLGSVTIINGLQPGNILTPIIPGNNLNPVNTSNSAGTVVSNNTDQISIVYVDQTFNNGLPVTGNYTVPSGGQFTVTAGTLAGLFPGDLIFLNRGTVFAIATVSGIAGNVVTLSAGDFSGLNKFGATDPLKTIAAPIPNLNANQQPPVLLYKFFFITFFVDSDGNLIRRELLAPPHTTIGGPTNVADQRTYNCAATCYYDNIIATGVEDLQFTYNLNGAQPAAVPVSDPGAGGSATNLGTAPLYRLNDIREVNVSLKVRAADRDTVVRDKNSPGGKNGYFYRFSLDGTFGVRNLYQTNYVPDLN